MQSQPNSMRLFRNLLVPGILALGTAQGASVLTKTHRVTAGPRCDLVSAPQTDTTACLDVSLLDGNTLVVPAGVTRLSSNGLVLCGKKEQGTDPMDIVYVVDQSASMTPQSILPLGKDTLAFYDCAAPSLMVANPVVDLNYHGQAVMVIAGADSTYARTRCNQAGDGTGIRSQIAQDAIRQQARLSPASQGAYVPFSLMYTSSGMVNLSDTGARGSLLRSIVNQQWTGTGYENPIGWARILLDGGNVIGGSPSVVPPSKNARKAIVMISDGEPTDADWATSILPKDSIGSPQSLPSYTSSQASPPIYSFLISESNRPGKALEQLSNQTGGRFTQIPPSDPDSLRRAISRILGSILGVGRPDSLRIVNTANGQVSTGVTGTREGGGYRVKLDSLVGLVPGSNKLQVRFVLTGGVKDSIVTAQWNVVVSDTASSYVANGTDSVLEASCGANSTLDLRPAKDTTRSFADSRDTLLRWLLTTRVENQGAMPVGFTTRISKDLGTKTLRWGTPPSGTWSSTKGSTSWFLGSANGTDTLIQTGNGWDTVRSVFHMPRDPRDSAVAVLPVQHPWLPWVRLAPDTIDGMSGTFSVRVRDPNSTADAVLVKVFHRLGDTVQIVLGRDTGSEYKGHVSFAQGQAGIKGDTLLQTGALRTNPYDSVLAVYSGLYRDTAVIHHAAPRLRFVGSSGNPVDTLPGASLDLGGSASFQVGLFVDQVLLSQSDSVVLQTPNWLEAASSQTGPVAKGLRLSAGTATVWIRGVASGTNGSVRMNLAGIPDSLVFRPVKVSAFRLRFVQAGGVLSDTLSIVRDVRKSALVQVQVWSTAGLCTPCTGPLRWASAEKNLVVTDTLNGTASLRIAGGTGWLRVRSDVPVANTALDLSFDSLGATAHIDPIRFLAPGPDSAEYFDINGDGALDLVRIHLGSGWTPASVFSLPWPDSTRFLDLGTAKVSLSSDSLTVEYAFAKPVLAGTTSWTTKPVPGTWAFQAGSLVRSFPIRERIAPMPVRARIGRGKSTDTLVVVASEGLDSTAWLAASELVRKLGAAPSLLSGRPFQWNASRREISLVFPSDSIDGYVVPGDSVRFPPNGAVSDVSGNRPGAVAPAVVVAGLDRPPYLAEVFDTDADGRADRVVLHFRTAPRVADSFSFGWPDRSGALATRKAALSRAKIDSNGRVLTLSVDPFGLGATSCPTTGTGCLGLGGMWSSRWGDSLRASFDETDSVAPVILSGMLRFAAIPGVPDTLRAEVSEPLQTVPGKEWLRWGRPARDSLGAAIGRISEAQTGPTSLLLLLDSSFQGRTGDSLRLGAAPIGGVADQAGVSPKRFAHWTPLDVGPFPERFAVSTWPSMVLDRNWDIPKSEPPLSLFVRSSSQEPWKTIDGKDPGQDPSHYAGILIRANRDMDAASVYLYDNIGTAVAFLDLSPLRDALDQGGVKTTLRGDFEAWVAWDGKSTGGQRVSGGVYPVRFLAWKKGASKTEFVNKLYRLGWIVPSK